ncbi:ATP-dependent RNA helicase dbp7 [Coemansia aciculifera]|uniref:ATP-dependent RNA helicase dbp7 n=1 Tax=Coemansia aciculifera TaxID=417176 RepID=A0ACC1M6W5_9FUNG|nr:ATP-dependent RNA helicase dbp7 [Coemansia aciculifera]
MADDDGLIFNFTTTRQDAPVLTTHGRPKGGKWKDRLESKRTLQTQVYQSQKKAREAAKSAPPAASAGDKDRADKQQDKEVQKLLAEISVSNNSKAKPASSTTTKPSSANVHLSGQASRQVVSSLFTKNPEIPSLPQAAASHEHNVSSNAVIDTSLFSGIGLDADMVSYLETKMEITKPTAIQQNAIPVLIGHRALAAPRVADTYGNDNDAFDVEREIRAEAPEHDVFIQAATGSGKTLTYMLPIIHRLLQATATAVSGTPPSRELGTFAIVLTPTRELAQQVYETAQTLVHMPISKDSGKKSHWMVPGIVIGGDKKQSEKGRLRKGVTILACTPGRLLDHLENTKSFLVDNLRWLVLDEADRLLELGFEETLTKILALLDEKAKMRVRVLGSRSMTTAPALPKRRINVLCSATLRDNVKKLANESLVNPKYINAKRVHDDVEQAAEEARPSKRRAISSDDSTGDLVADEDENDDEDNFSVPSQLVQKAVIVPAKLRLVTLVAQLKNTFRKQPTSKIIVFLSCKDSVDFMYFLLAHSGQEPDAADVQQGDATDELVQELFKNMDDSLNNNDDDSDDNGGDSDNESGAKSDGAKRYGKADKSGPTLKEDEIVLDSSVFPGAKVYRLHGSMQQKRRTETFSAFSKSKHASILFTTDVAARGLDLPNVTSIIQFDPPSDVASYLHRVGRTARLGRVGEAILFLLPSESAYLTLLQEKGLRPSDESMESVLKLMAKSEGVRKATEWQLRAGDVQAMLERFVVVNVTASGLAKQAYLSSIRAYATHISAERHIFHVRSLHFGHLAKAFALRETPNQVAMGKGNNTKADGAKKDKKEKKEKELAIKKKPTFKRGNDISEFAVGDISAYYGPRVKNSKYEQ